MTTVLISYSHAPKGHREQVLRLALQLRASGLDVRLDRFIRAPWRTWSTWMDRQLEEANYVLIIWSRSYAAGWEGRNPIGRGRGAAWEAAVIKGMLYDQQLHDNQLRILLFQEYEDGAELPGRLAANVAYGLPSDEEQLCIDLGVTRMGTPLPPELEIDQALKSEGTLEPPRLLILARPLLFWLQLISVLSMLVLLASGLWFIDRGSKARQSLMAETLRYGGAANELVKQLRAYDYSIPLGLLVEGRVTAADENTLPIPYESELKAVVPHGDHWIAVGTREGAVSSGLLFGNDRFDPVQGTRKLRHAASCRDGLWLAGESGQGMGVLLHYTSGVSLGGDNDVKTWSAIACTASGVLAAGWTNDQRGVFYGSDRVEVSEKAQQWRAIARAFGLYWLIGYTTNTGRIARVSGTGLDEIAISDSSHLFDACTYDNRLYVVGDLRKPLKQGIAFHFEPTKPVIPYVVPQTEKLHGVACHQEYGVCAVGKQGDDAVVVCLGDDGNLTAVAPAVSGVEFEDIVPTTNGFVAVGKNQTDRAVAVLLTPEGYELKRWVDASSWEGSALIVNTEIRWWRLAAVVSFLVILFVAHRGLVARARFIPEEELTDG